ARVDDPVLRLARGIQQAVGRHLRVDAHGRRRENQRDGKPKYSSCLRAFVANVIHRHRPFSDSRYAMTSASSSSLSVDLNDGIGDVVAIAYSRRSAFVSETSRS